MKLKNILIAFCLLFGTPALTTLGAPAAGLPVIPAPWAATFGDGAFTFTPRTTFGVENEVQLQIVSDFTTRLGRSAGFLPGIAIGDTSAAVQLVTDTALSGEAYRLSVTPDRIMINASSPAGFFYALQSLRQLLPPQIEDARPQTALRCTVPAVTIEDAPRFGYRGIMIDVARFFVPKQELLKIIDAAAFLKINKLHLHLVDDNGWRLEIRRYPELTKVGAWRVDRNQPFPNRKNPEPGEYTPVGGYYTQDDIREIVQYAARCQIDVIPEIEMPAHSNSALAAYPGLACPVVDRYIGVLPGIGGKNAEIVYCAGNDSVFTFLQHVIDEVAELFPSRYIHLGGDEAAKTLWEKCPRCQARLQKEHISHIEELQSYFMTRMVRYAQSKGKEVMGWDELTNSTLPEGVIIYGWQGMGGAALKAAAQGHRFVMTPAKVLYFIRYQGPQWFEPLTYFGNNTLKDVYQYEPVQEEWPAAYENLLMGVQASMWTEFCSTPEELEYQLFPRLLALADVAWGAKDRKDWPDFLSRLDQLLPHVERMGITVAPSMYNIDHKVTPVNGTLQVELSCIRPDVEIRYTDDGTEPAATSRLYTSPFVPRKGAIIKAATFSGGEKKGQTLLLDLLNHNAVGKNVLARNDKEYLLTNGLRGSLRHTDFEWAGWYDQDAGFVIDLGRKLPLKEVSLGTITNSGMAVHKPSAVTLSISDDNQTFVTVGEVHYTEEEIFHNRTAVEDIVFSKLNRKARYLRFEAKNPGPCPEGDIREGQKTWLYFDEVIVK